MQELRYLEVSHRRASVGSAIPGKLGWDKGAGQGHQTYPAEYKGGITLHIERTPTNTRLNRSGGYELPGCWITTMKKLGGGADHASTIHSCASASISAPNCMGMQAQESRL